MNLGSLEKKLLVSLLYNYMYNTYYERVKHHQWEQIEIPSPLNNFHHKIENIITNKTDSTKI